MEGSEAKRFEAVISGSRSGPVNASGKRRNDHVDPPAAARSCDARGGGGACPGLPKHNIMPGRRRGPPCRAHDCCQVASTWDERDDAATTLHPYEQRPDPESDEDATVIPWCEMCAVAAPGRVARKLGLVVGLSSSRSLRDTHARQHPHLPWDRLPEFAHALTELLETPSQA